MDKKELKKLNKIANKIRAVVSGIVDISPLKLGKGYYSLEIFIKTDK